MSMRGGKARANVAAPAGRRVLRGNPDMQGGRRPRFLPFLPADFSLKCGAKYHAKIGG